MILRLKDGWLEDAKSSQYKDFEEEDPYFERIEFIFKNITRTIYFSEGDPFDSKLCEILKQVIFDYNNISQITEQECADELYQIARKMLKNGSMSCNTKHV